MRRKNVSQSASNFARVIVVWKSTLSARLSISTAACVADERDLLARSHAVRKRRRARALPVKSILDFFLNSSTQYDTNVLSKSSPEEMLS